MEGRKRTVQVKFYVTEEERRLIREKMKLIPTRNMAAYLRKMAIDGYVVHGISIEIVWGELAIRSLYSLPR